MWKKELNRDTFHFHLMETFKTLCRRKCLLLCYLSIIFVLYLSPKFIVSVTTRFIVSGFLKNYISCNHNLRLSKTSRVSILFLLLLQQDSFLTIIGYKECWQYFSEVTQIYQHQIFCLPLFLLSLTEKCHTLSLLENLPMFWYLFCATWTHGFIPWLHWNPLFYYFISFISSFWIYLCFLLHFLSVCL